MSNARTDAAPTIPAGTHCRLADGTRVVVSFKGALSGRRPAAPGNTVVMGRDMIRRTVPTATLTLV